MIGLVSTASHDPPEPTLERLLAHAVGQRASDIHFEPTAEQFEIRSRIDGKLDEARQVDVETGRMLVNRMMVAAKLLTYRQDVPQEGRFSVEPTTLEDDERAGLETLDLRLAVMPTTHGLRAVVRLPAELHQPRGLDALGLPQRVLDGLYRFAATDGGLLLLSGPAGSGKTTTMYALLEHLTATETGLSVLTIEDPVERDLPGVTQIQVTPFGELTYETALRSVLRQDPQVLMLGEIRDRATATIAVQAAMSGHRLISTLHAGSEPGAVMRLLEMGLEPYQLAGSLFGVVSIRLLRRADQPAGRVPLASFAQVAGPVRDAVLAGNDAQAIDQAIRRQRGYTPLRQAADDLIQAAMVHQDEVQRVLGKDSS